MQQKIINFFQDQMKVRPARSLSSEIVMESIWFVARRSMKVRIDAVDLFWVGSGQDIKSRIESMYRYSSCNEVLMGIVYSSYFRAYSLTQVLHLCVL